MFQFHYNTKVKKIPSRYYSNLHTSFLAPLQFENSSASYWTLHLPDKMTIDKIRNSPSKFLRSYHTLLYEPVKLRKIELLVISYHKPFSFNMQEIKTHDSYKTHNKVKSKGRESEEQTQVPKQFLKK